MSKKSGNQSYGAESIKVLKGLEAVKKRPGMYIGDTEDGSGLHHMVYEVTDNAVDEALAGFCDKIIIILNADASVTVLDNGRGIPVDTHKEEGVSAAELIMTQLHAGGKFDDNAYKVSGGLHGVGVSVVNALSEWLELKVYRDGKEYSMRFEHGHKVREIESKPSEDLDKTGTQVTFLPSDKTFSHINFDFVTLENKFRELAFLNPEVTIELFDRRTDEEKVANLHFEGGIENFVKYLDRSKHPINKPIRVSGEQNNIFIDVAFQWNNSYHENTLTFTNNIRQKEGGAHLTGFRGALTRVINNYIETNQLQKKQKIKISAEDMREGLTSVVSTRVPDPKFSSQTKDKLISGEVRTVVESIVSEEFSKWLEINPKEAKNLMSRMAESAMAREAARKARDISRKQSVNQISTLPGKLANCQEKDPAKSELFLVEGDSAGGSAKQGRDRATQAILPLKGKILNVERARFDKMLNSAEIGTLITALNVTLENKEFDLSKLRYHKIIIMTDADVDGAHIRTLLLTFFFRYMPELIEKGYLYIAQPPLYKVKRGQSDTYLKNESKLQIHLKEIILKNINIKNESGDIKEIENITKDIIDFSHIIQSVIGQIPAYIIETLVFDGFFNINNNEKYSVNSILDVLNANKTEDQQLKWECNLLENQSLEIIKTEKGVKESHIISQNLFHEGKKEKVSKLSEKIKDIILEHNFYYKDEKLEFNTAIDLVAKLFKLSKKGLYIQRFKGLGEMNPDQLWETTLDPQNRTLLQVSVKDANEADEVFSTLMGDIVEPRRDFITTNALKVANLDY
ncbi:MAG: DNA gyrase subunit B [Candidatus Midichloriaceae bacterium]|jgi:DNA gyrase subunit B